MDLRNITRSLLFNRALYKLNKAIGEVMIWRDIYVLMSIYYVCGINGSCYRWEIYNYLKKIKRMSQMERIKGVLDKLIALGLVVRHGKRYGITISGKLVLDKLEEILREERYDR